MRVDLFCRVIDNLGDAAICWRLARQLAQEHGCAVRLWIDQPEVLARLVPGARASRAVQGVRIEAWQAQAPVLARPRSSDVAEVVIAAFGCDLPPAYRSAMRATRSVWINLEYFSAEPWTLGSHGLPSPKSDGLTEHFFFPGPGPATGGLLRERRLQSEREAFQNDPWARSEFLARFGISPAPGQRIVSVFTYPDAAWPALIQALQTPPANWLVLVPEGVLEALGPAASAPGVTVCRIPFLSQDDYDRLLWSCDLNLVRGEDSLIRALWAGRPMLWQAYPQAQGAHLPKVQAWLDHLLAHGGSQAIARAWLAWNDRSGAPSEADVGEALGAALACWRDWQGLSAAMMRREAALPSLAPRLLEFVTSRL